MGGHLLNGQAQAGGLAAEPLGPDADLVDGLQQFPLQGRVVGVRVGDVQGAEQGFLGQVGHLVKATAHADAQHDGGAGVGTRQLHRLQNKLLEALNAVGGFQHLNPAHVFTAEALGGHGDLAAVPIHQMNGDGRGGVVAGVAPAKGVGHNALAQVARAVTLADALVDGLFKAALDMNIGAQLHKNAGHAGVLADGQVGGLGGPQVIPEQI